RVQYASGMSARMSCTVRAAACSRFASAVEMAALAPPAVASRTATAAISLIMEHLCRRGWCKYDSRMPPRKKAVRRKKAAPASVGLTAAETRSVASPDLDRLAAQVEADGGAVVGRYNDPFGGTPLLLAALPVDRVQPTPYQRDASDAH